MAKVVGFDFGTHQTKVCIADNDDPRNVVYEFLPFPNSPTGEVCYVMPSMVQINTDKTISYGWVDEGKCIELINDKLAPNAPLFVEELPHEPSYPEPPVRPDLITKETALQLIIEANTRKKAIYGKRSRGIPKTEENIAKLVELKNLKNEKAYKDAYQSWERKCAFLKSSFNKDLEETIARNKIRKDDYDALLKEARTPKPQSYLNFKYSVFSGQDTRNVLSAEQVSLFYITYIIFLLEEKYGTDFSIQFGVPASPQTYKQLRNLATRLIIRAFQLVEDVFENDIDRFLSTSYEELMALSALPEFSEKVKEEYGIMIIPEASACLRAIVAAGRLPEGKLHIMMDIGGGTTDISFFVVNNHEPIIYWFRSVPQGLNFIREAPGNGDKYRQIINDTVKNLKRELSQEFLETGNPIHFMEDAMNGNVVVYNGGGSAEKGLCRPYQYFTTVRRISDILPIHFHQDEILGLSHILSNSYGLSNQIDNEDVAVRLRPFNELLKKYKEQVKEAKKDPVHHSEYEHGLSDFD